MINENKQYSTDQIFKLLKSKKSDFWVAEGRRRSLDLFHAAARRVPAYKDFLKKHGINPAKIKTWDDFQNVPIVDKKNYLRQYPLEKLCWDGSLKKPLVFTSTSGSTGEPFYFPRDERLDWQSSITHEMFLRSSGINKKQSTLVIVCFGMGVWIGGLITYQAFRMISQRDYPITILTPGVNKKEIFDAIINLGSKFDRIILCGYPPFIKDLIDEAKDHNISWSKLDLRIIFAAEVFSEKFRNYIIKKTGIKNIFADTMNIYGSADLGTMATETPISILIRRLILENKNFFKSVFLETGRIPTLAQFNPLLINFESVDGSIICTGYNALPLIRYDIGDRGGVVSFKDITARLEESDNGIALNKEIKKSKIDKPAELPFVYIFERNDFSIKLYGAIIYPEHVRQVLQSDSLSEFLTGKFTMLTKTNKKHDQSLEINIELKSNIKAPDFLMYKARSMLVKALIEKNAEYRNNYNMMPDKIKPNIVFWDYEDPTHFKSGIKQKWAKK